MDFQIILGLILTILLIGVMVVGISLTIKHEHQRYNKGICPNCGSPLELADYDSQGGRLWMCKKNRMLV